MEWTALEKLNLIWNMKEVRNVFEEDIYSKFFSVFENGEYHGTLLGRGEMTCLKELIIL